MHHPFLVQLTYFLTFFQRQWLHSSVGRASHRYREVTGSNPVEVLNFFSGFFIYTQLHKLRSLRRSFLHFHNLFLAAKLLMGWELALKAQFTPTPHSFDPWNILLLLNLIFQAY